MVNTTYPEFAETKAPSLPVAEVQTLWNMRKDMCAVTETRDFKLQAQQRFLRRVLGPDSPTQSLLMVHGTGTGKTCTAIQIAEEYVVRPEFQGKKVLVIANPAVQNNFKSQVFDVSKVNVDEAGLLLSKQCTGRRYLDILQRAQNLPSRLTSIEGRDKLRKLSEKLLSEFYEFQGYLGFSNYVDIENYSESHKTRSAADFDTWIHETFDNRLIIIDEAHNIRVTTETTTNKLFAKAIEYIVKHATGVVLVLLTATPMFDKFEEILYYFTLFLWNERKLDPKKQITVSEIFNEKTGGFKPDQEERFRRWCQTYVSYVKGDNPFTFPFRLPPPDTNIAEIDRTTDPFGERIKESRRYLTLTKSFVSSFQERRIKQIKSITATPDTSLIAVYPDYKTFSETFATFEGQYVYRDGVEPFLAPSKVSKYSSKFALIMKMLDTSNGVVFVYSNSVEDGTNLFAMCLEEHGYVNAFGTNFLKSTSGEIAKGSKGKYALFTGEVKETEIKSAMLRLKARTNANGEDVRVIIASPKVSEGVDFKFVRQIHVLDPWWNMSRIEQVLGRGMRTCSHSELPPEEQNCTVYLHTCRYPDTKQETFDEYIYRVFVEQKAIKIARVKRVIMESAMDCDLEIGINNLPNDWKQLTIPQVRSQDKQVLNLTLQEMSAPTFEDTVTDLVCRLEEEPTDEEHVRPLSSVVDIRDEVFNKLIALFMKKPIWKLRDLYSHSMMKQYSKSVLDYLIQNAIETGFQLKGSNGRIGTLRSINGILSIEFADNETLAEKLVNPNQGSIVDLPKAPILEAKDVEEVREEVNIDAKRDVYDFPTGVRENFGEDVLNWFIVDNVLTEKERIQHILNVDWEDPPIYAKPLRIEMQNGNYLYVLGSNKIYNQDKVLTVPIGDEKDAYNAWLNRQKNTFVNARNQIYATSKDQKFLFNIENDLNEGIRRAVRSKSFKARMCSTFDVPVLKAFATFLSEEFPESIKTKPQQCLYLDLLFRRAVLSAREGIFWLAPELHEIFDEPENREDIRKRLK